MAKPNLKRDSVVQEARERFERASSYWKPVYDQIREDLEFSDPTDPKQWPEQIKRERENSDGGPRPCYTFDQVGQFVRQVVNTARKNKPAIRYLPVDEKSDPQTAEVLQGLARQTEYVSRADTAYIGALDSATRGGLGWFRLVIEDLEDSPIEGQKVAKILRVPDFRSITIDPDSMELDGSDATFAFVEEQISRTKFDRLYPKAKTVQTDSQGWFSEERVRVCEYYRIAQVADETIRVAGQQITDEQFAALQALDPTIQPDPPKTRKVVEHYKISGEEILEQTTFPSEYIPLFPVLGNESWDDGKRMLAGCVRTARDAQISYNITRNSEIETISLQPKVPWVGPREAIEGYENEWKRANSGNLGYLPYNLLDEAGNPITAPQRTQPVGVASGWVQLREAARNDVQSALGMYEANVGNNPNQQSGRAVLALQDKADVGTYAYIDNLAAAISHCGRVLTQVWPAIYDQAQIVRIIGEDDEPAFVRVDPQAQGYVEGEIPTINPAAGKYDVRVTVGPTFATKQTEAAAMFGEVINGNPAMLSLLGDLWVKWNNFPDADRISRRFKAMLPPQVQAAENEQPTIPPEAQQALQQAAQEITQLRQALQEAQSGFQAELLKAQTQIKVAEMNNEVKYDIEELRGMVQMLVQQLQPPPQLAQDVSQDMSEIQ